jgi:ribosomal protein S18 acetylase RimI-like enzyme
LAGGTRIPATAEMPEHLVATLDTLKESMNKIEIQRVTLKDIDQLQKVGRQTFYETFSAGNTEENMKRYLDEGFSVEKLTAELNDQNAEFYFATLEGNVIGYLKLNFGQSQTELKDDKALEIERIYVLKEFHGKKVGQLLYEKAIQIARQKSADYVWLGVWEENPRAINFYKKNGFVEFDKHVFKLGEDEQTDIMMKLQLKSNEQ